MKDKIEQIAKLAAELAEEKSKSPYVGSAIMALKAAADNLQWHTESVERGTRNAEQAPPPAGSTAAAMPPPIARSQ